MKTNFSILNHVLGPVTRGPSSSHTAGPYFIGQIFYKIFGEKIDNVEIIFDPNGSFAKVYKAQCSDVALVAGLSGMSITDELFEESLRIAWSNNIKISFHQKVINGSNHPNAIRIEAISMSGRKLCMVAESIGGGAVCIKEVDEIRINHNCMKCILLIQKSNKIDVEKKLNNILLEYDLTNIRIYNNLFDLNHQSLILDGQIQTLEKVKIAIEKYNITAYILPVIGIPIIYEGGSESNSIKDIIKDIKISRMKISEYAIKYESCILGLAENEIKLLMRNRWNVMKKSIDCGFMNTKKKMLFLSPTASKFLDAYNREKLFCGGKLAIASAASLAVMEMNSSRGIVCAAPTAGSCGIIPGILYAIKEHQVTDEEIVNIMFTMGMFGILVLLKATFAAEVCGCAAEVGVASALAAAGAVEFAGGTTEQSFDAASLCLMNNFGLICDPVQGIVEIPCHARNISGVAGALAACDAVLGGFKAIIPFDEIIDCMYQVGKKLPPEFKCTAEGGLANTNYAKKLNNISHDSYDGVKCGSD